MSSSSHRPMNHIEPYGYNDYQIDLTKLDWKYDKSFMTEMIPRVQVHDVLEQRKDILKGMFHAYTQIRHMRVYLEQFHEYLMVEEKRLVLHDGLVSESFIQQDWPIPEYFQYRNCVERYRKFIEQMEGKVRDLLYPVVRGTLRPIQRT